MKSIIVTGSNKGIGYAIVQRLLPGNYNIIMAVRNPQLGEQAKQELLSNQYPQDRIRVLPLDVSDSTSIDNFIEILKKEVGTVDILVNNAGMAFKGDRFDEEVVRVTFQTNYYGTVEFTEKMIPLINKDGKIVNIGSTAGLYGQIKNEAALERLRSQDITKQQLNEIASTFQEHVKANTYEQNGFPKSGYGMSKVFLNTYTRILSQQPQIVNSNIQVYVCCPGWCRTDMAGDKAPKSKEEGADTPLYLIELPSNIDQQYQGKFFSEKQIKSLG